MEAVRIIKEMREATNGKYPKYAVWENVPGAFSSNKGEDFRAVLEELARIKEAGISIPGPDKSKWAKAGLITGNDWSIAWRTMDAQHWGVPQRRLRISLVFDLTGGRAGEILFEPESLRGHFAPGITPGQAATGAVENGAGTADRAFTLKPAKNQGGIAILDALPFDTTQITSPQNGSKPHFGDHCHPLAATAHPPAAVCEMVSTESIVEPTVCYAATTEPNMVICNDCSPAIRSRDYKDPNIVCYDARGNGDGMTSPTITGDHNSRVTDYTSIVLQSDAVAGALLAHDYKGLGMADSLGRVITKHMGADLYNGTLTGDKAVTLTAAIAKGGTNTGPSVIERITRWIVRRLTPTECERLQGYPAGWTDLGEWVDSKGKAHKAADTPRYKALGNSIALPQWYYVLGGIADRLPDNATLGSLFDGIGGFPYVWAKLHNDDKSLCVWASEIEEFPIAVTKKQFPENNS